MADNYLERKMEELRDGGRRVVRVVSNPAGTLVVKFPFASVLVIARKADERTALLLSRLTSTGAKVGLAGADADAARRVAKARGATFVPQTDAEAARAMFAGIVAEPELVLYDEGDDGIRACVGERTLALGSDVEKALLRLLFEI